jgi:hypothetical protein
MAGHVRYTGNFETTVRLGPPDGGREAIEVEARSAIVFVVPKDEKPPKAEVHLTMTEREMEGLLSELAIRLGKMVITPSPHCHQIPQLPAPQAHTFTIKV